MFLHKCGNWAHLPDNVLCEMDVRLFLRVIGARIGRTCKKHPGNWHYHPPKGWTIDTTDERQILRDHNNCARARLTNADSPEFVLERFHKSVFSQELTTLDDEEYAVLAGFLISELIDVVCFTFSVAPRTDDPRETRPYHKRFARDTLAFFHHQMPEFESPFSYWDNVN